MCNQGCKYPNVKPAPIASQYDANRQVPLRIEGYELELRAKAKGAGEMEPRQTTLVR